MTAWQEFNASLAGIPDELWQQPNTIGEWSLQDILGHIATWENEAIKYIPVILEGKRLPRYKDMYGGIDAFNAMTVAENRKLSLAEAHQHSAQTHQKLLDYLQALPEDNFASGSRVLRRILLDTYGHYPYHTKAIREWREQMVGRTSTYGNNAG
jgi:uncharacterized damage-inducible protein DinB